MAGSSNDPRINLVRISHVFYTHKDIEKAHQFLLDFGFQEVKRVDGDIYYGGSGLEPFVYCARQGKHDEFGGAAFVVESESDLVAATKLPGATKIYDLRDAPGGGRCVTFHDPVDNFPFHLVSGQKPHADEKAFPQLDFNFPTDKHRSGNKTQRFKKGPAPVHKLGHFGMCVTDFAKALDFYTTRFNFKPSDLVHDSTGRDITAFLHLDRGSELVDHHCFFFSEGPRSHIHHSSFETHDFDTQVLGHDWLRSKGYENCWGVGRHIMGSQIFDYWFDTSRFIIEHYVDGDLVNDQQPTNRSLATPDNLHVWGPDLPPTFLQ
ncbi:oxidoreductase [Penicillium daleae]|uniref:Oxidoreductase n=1 Tax=Penicillium daleae TaxID=63821 RepID=A0AAD6CG84_9EURO|nr:oxidoreductase [Penicillium daleae]KAJ5464806.1 oxidoreductase [Penicillium daleae]